MKPDVSHKALKDDPSLQSTLSVEEWWEDKKKPSRKRRKQLTPYQRHCLAVTFRQLRAERLAATRAASK